MLYSYLYVTHNIIEEEDEEGNKLAKEVFPSKEGIIEESQSGQHAVRGLVEEAEDSGNLVEFHIVRIE